MVCTTRRLARAYHRWALVLDIVNYASMVYNMALSSPLHPPSERLHEGQKDGHWKDRNFPCCMEKGPFNNCMYRLDPAFLTSQQWWDFPMDGQQGSHPQNRYWKTLHRDAGATGIVQLVKPGSTMCHAVLTDYQPSWERYRSVTMTLHAIFEMELENDWRVMYRPSRHNYLMSMRQCLNDDAAEYEQSSLKVTCS